jgi:hypothetical protein
MEGLNFSRYITLLAKKRKGAQLVLAMNKQIKVSDLLNWDLFGVPTA